MKEKKKLVDESVVEKCRHISRLFVFLIGYQSLRVRQETGEGEELPPPPTVFWNQYKLDTILRHPSISAILPHPLLFFLLCIFLSGSSNKFIAFNQEIPRLYFSNERFLGRNYSVFLWLTFNCCDLSILKHSTSSFYLQKEPTILESKLLSWSILASYYST